MCRIGVVEYLTDKEGEEYAFWTDHYCGLCDAVWIRGVAVMNRPYVAGKFVSCEGQERLERLRAAFDEVGDVLKKYDLSIPDLYREYVFRARGSKDMRFGVDRDACSNEG